jgi:hypothetical protein
VRNFVPSLLVFVLFACRMSNAPGHPEWPRQASFTSELGDTAPIGTRARLAIADARVGPESCTDEGCGQRCERPSEAVSSRLSALSCEGIPCTATLIAHPAEGAWSIDVSADTPGTAEIIATLVDDSGETITARRSMKFVAADRIDVTRAPRETPFDTSHAVVAGASFTWCAKLVIDAVGGEGFSMVATGPVEVESKVSGLSRCDTFRTTAAGEVLVTYAGLGASRRERIRVIGGAEVTDLALLDMSASRGVVDLEPLPIDLDTTSDAPALTTLDRCAAPTWGTSDTPGYLVAVRATTRDGTIAFAAVSILEGAMLETADPEHSAALGAGSLSALLVFEEGDHVTASLGTASLDVVATACRDAGAD